MKKLMLLSVVGLIQISSVVLASERDESDIFVLEAGLHFGGDTLATIYTTDGDNETVKAGNGVSLAVGLRFGINENIDTVITIGNKTDTVTASDSLGGEYEFSFTRNPLNALILSKHEDWHFGAGLTYHTGVEYELKTPYGSATVPFKDALGFIADFRWFFSAGGYVGGRYTNIDYEVESSGASFNGSSIGVVVGVYL